MNQVTLIGNLTKDLEVKEFAGSKVYNGTLAVARSYTKDKTDFIPISIWGQLGETVAKYNGKGSKLLVQGDLNIDQVGEKYFTKVNVRDVEFLTSKKEATRKDMFGNPLVDDEPPVTKKQPEPQFDAAPKKFTEPEGDLPF
jgi:single-strand DNA-binding protein